MWTREVILYLLGFGIWDYGHIYNFINFFSFGNRRGIYIDIYTYTTIYISLFL